MHYPRDIAYARHAMSIDEYRKTFKRVPWGGSKTIREAMPGEPQPFEQVWFAGNHADIGGSYPENESRLSDYPLQWIADFICKGLPSEGRVAVNAGLLNLHPSADGMMHDEVMAGGVGGTVIPWRKRERPVDAAGTLHASVLERLELEKVRNFVSYGPYRPLNLKNHPKAKRFYVGLDQTPTYTAP